MRFGETDAAGIVFYPTFFAWFDLGVQNLVRDGERAAHHADGSPHVPLPIVEAGATFVAPLMMDEEITIVSTVAELGRTSLRVEHEIKRGETLIAKGFEVRVYVTNNSSGIAKAPFPDDLRARLARGPDPGPVFRS
ncbi:MAG: acyl-CoA thioesterase [Candidatus Velthaea sp.]